MEGPEIRCQLSTRTKVNSKDSSKRNEETKYFTKATVRCMCRLSLVIMILSFVRSAHGKKKFNLEI